MKCTYDKECLNEAIEKWEMIPPERCPYTGNFGQSEDHFEWIRYCCATHCMDETIKKLALKYKNKIDERLRNYFIVTIL